MKKFKFYHIFLLLLLSVTACTPILNDTPPPNSIDNEVPNCAADGVGCQQIYTPENPSPLTKEELQFHKEWKRWNAKKINHYSFSVKRNCFCLPEEAINIVVRNNKIVSSQFIPSHKPLPKERQDTLMTINDYFKKIDRAFKERYAHIGLKYHVQYHFPTEIFFDYRAGIADDEIGYQLSDFKVMGKEPHSTPNEEQLSCIEIYKPVCGKVQVQCVTTPCPPLMQTFSNSCYLSRNRQATFLHEGVCE